MKCPHCDADLKLTAMPFNSEVLYVSVQHEPDSPLNLKTVSGLLREMEKLLLAVGHDLGQEVAVFLQSVEMSGTEAKFGLLIVEKGRKDKARKAAQG